MSFIVAGLICEYPVRIDDMSFVETSFPEFETLMNQCGFAITSDS
jgi:5-enolpyruvylshikimate-3-phosphate synthase